AEQCHAGNQVGGDCCPATCQLDVFGSPCDDGNPCTPTDTCAAGTCLGGTAPRGGCRSALAGSVLLKHGTSLAKDVLSSQWSKSAATTLADFGDPVGGTSGYTLCLYDADGASSRLRLASAAPA